QIMGTVFAAEEDKCAKYASDTSGFIVILEEPLGGPDAKYCFRVCTAEPEGGKRICELKDKCEGTGDYTCKRVQIIEASSGTNLLNQYVKMIYLWAAGTIGIVAVLTIVISGVEIMAKGASGSIDEPKNRISQALLGLVILFLSGLILYTINPTFFV
ncbi:hypothetical protein ACFLZH_01865, partial [Patescibacteria group bacterium]